MNTIITGTLIYKNSDEEFKNLINEIVTNDFIECVKESIKYYENDLINPEKSLELACTDEIDNILFDSPILIKFFDKIKSQLNKLNLEFSKDDPDFNIDYEITKDEFNYIKKVIKNKINGSSSN